ncbi:hypothetical protein GNZ13_22710 [Paraburkholderia sp. 5N]|uniref:Uncharacterized protein n=1 Tax=Paraburkholderia elongata TaxID=2675747 RepID=A0A972NPM4_9BURK|nr:hypothetical protein [Paraburkholderia elongata]
MKTGQLTIRHGAGHGRDTARGLSELRQGIEQATVVGSIRRRLNDDMSLDAQPPLQRAMSATVASGGCNCADGSTGYRAS